MSTNLPDLADAHEPENTVMEPKCKSKWFNVAVAALVLVVVGAPIEFYGLWISLWGDYTIFNFGVFLTALAMVLAIKTLMDGKVARIEAIFILVLTLLPIAFFLCQLPFEIMIMSRQH